MRGKSRSIGVVVVLGLLLGLVGLTRSLRAVHSQRGVQRAFPLGTASHPPEEGPDQIVLRSRQFAPAEGVEPGLAEAIETTPGKQDGRAHVLLQLYGVPDASDLATLEAAGIRLLNYIPRNAWFASMPAQGAEGTLARAEAAEVVRWVGQILPEDKAPARLRAGEIGVWAVADDGRLRLSVSFFDDVSLETGRQVVAGHGGEIEGESHLLNQLSLLLAAEELSALVAEDTVRWVDQIPPPYATHNDGAREATNVDAVQALPYELSGMGVTVGIWDGGAVEATHDDFEDDGGSSRVTAADVVTVSNHSTHVGGTVAGNGARSAALGGTYRQWRGMAPQAEIVSYDFQGNLGAELGEAIITYTIDLSQNSWGFTVDEEKYNNCGLYGDYHAASRFYDLIITGALGRRIPVVFAAGNERNDKDCGMDPNPPYGSNYGIIPPPATAKNVINVGATNSHDDSMTLFSSWGPLDDGRLSPHVMAPGCEENPVREDAVYTQTMWSTWPGSGYGGMCGTSMAAPVVSGIGALLFEQYGRTPGGAPLPSTLKALLVHGAKDLSDGTSWYNPGPDYASGYGLVDAMASADLIIDRAFREDLISVDDETDVFTVTVPSGLSELKVTLAWDDPAATENASPTLINDLDLVVRDPSMVVHDPWVLNPANPAANATRGVDRVNNLEQVLVASPAAGTWTISVRGFHVPQAPQPYSLVSELLAFESVYLPLVLKNYSAGTANEPPNTPSSPAPADGATEQDVDVNLSWTGGDPDGDDVAYDVYVEAADDTPDVLVCGAASSATCNPGSLSAETHYYWQVVATDEHDAVTVGPVWDFTTAAGQMLHGTVTDRGAAAGGEELLLRFYNGPEWSTYSITTTDAGGAYQFTSLPDLVSDQGMYVRWLNQADDETRLATWSCLVITSSTTDPSAYQCDFDLENIELLEPEPGASVGLPQLFTWERRALTNDSYEVNITDPHDGDPWWWTDPPLGYVDSYTLTGLPPGFSTGVQYGWWMWVYGPDGYGESYWMYYVTFTGGGALLGPPVPWANGARSGPIEFGAHPGGSPRVSSLIR